jgi:hypothetical protein
MRRNIRSLALHHEQQTANARLIGFRISHVVALTGSLQLSIHDRSHWCHTTLSLNTESCSERLCFACLANGDCAGVTIARDLYAQHILRLSQLADAAHACHKIDKRISRLMRCWGASAAVRAATMSSST